MTSPETLNMKFSINELIFLLVTHTAYSNAWFDSYRILMLGQGAEMVWTDWTYRRMIRFYRLKMHDSWSTFSVTYRFYRITRVVNRFCRPLTQLSNAYS
jgi:hypothetical protein